MCSFPYLVIGVVAGWLNPAGTRLSSSAPGAHTSGEATMQAAAKSKVSVSRGRAPFPDEEDEALHVLGLGHPCGQLREN